MMTTKLARIADKAKADRKLRFTSLAHLLTPEFLLETWKQMNHKGASGVDGETVKEFESDLETRVEQLCARLKARQYRPPPVLGQTHRRHRSVEFRKFLDLVEASVAADVDVHLIMDNYGTHKTALIRNWFAKRHRFHVHFTPTYSSWLNLIERWFAELTNKQIRRGAHHSVQELERAIQDFLEAHNAAPRPFTWTKGADEILASIERFARRTLDVHSQTT